MSYAVVRVATPLTSNLVHIMLTLQPWNITLFSTHNTRVLCVCINVVIEAMLRLCDVDALVVAGHVAAGTYVVQHWASISVATLNLR